MNNNATNHTQFFGFPLFIDSDKPSILTDWNGTMEELDTTLEDYRTRISGCEQTTTSFMDQVNILKNRIDELVTRISTDELSIDDNRNEIIALKDAVVVADTSIKRILTRLAELEPEIIENVNDIISGVEADFNSEISNLNLSISGLQSDIVNVTDRVETAEREIESLYNVSAEDLLALYPIYIANHSYSQKDIVRKSGTSELYVSLVNNNNHDLSEINYWMQLSLARLSQYSSLIINANDAYSLADEALRSDSFGTILNHTFINGILAGLGIKKYQTNTTYTKGSIVYVKTNSATIRFYKALYDTTTDPSVDTTNWTLVFNSTGTEAEDYFVEYISNQFFTPISSEVSTLSADVASLSLDTGTNKRNINTLFNSRIVRSNRSNSLSITNWSSSATDHSVLIENLSSILSDRDSYITGGELVLTVTNPIVSVGERVTVLLNNIEYDGEITGVYNSTVYIRFTDGLCVPQNSMTLTIGRVSENTPSEARLTVKTLQTAQQ